jgi:hypothetical protein
MLESILAVIITILQFIVIVPFYAFVIYVIYYRKKFITVDIFGETGSKLPGEIQSISTERILESARSLTYRTQFFLTNHRIIFFYQSLLGGKHLTRYFKINTVKNVGIVYKNPYGWLIYSGLNLILGISLAISAGNSKTYYRDDGNTGTVIAIIFATLIYAGLYVLLWYYLKGYYLAFDNNRVVGLFCRSSEGLQNILNNFDLLRFSETNSMSSIQKETKDVTCSSCKSVITLESEDLKSETFVCPVCKTINSL